MDSPWLSVTAEQERLARIRGDKDVRGQILDQYVEMANKHEKAKNQLTDAKNKIQNGDESLETKQRFLKAESDEQLYRRMKEQLDSDLSQTGFFDERVE